MTINMILSDKSLTFYCPDLNSTVSHRIRRHLKVHVAQSSSEVYIFTNSLKGLTKYLLLFNYGSS